MSFNAESYLDENYARYCKIRQDLHAHPELAFEENRTAAFVADYLTDLGLQVQQGLGRTGVLATLERGQGPTIALRADMDALPQDDLTRLPYASMVNGKAHACGHDGHTTILLAAADLLSRSPEFSGKVHFIFQPAEEVGKGALAFAADERYGSLVPDLVFGFHNWPGLEVGTIESAPGPIMAAFHKLEIILTGKGGHAALPHLATNHFRAISDILANLPDKIARALPDDDRYALAFTQLHGGDAINVIPDQIELMASFRWLDEDNVSAMRDELASYMADIETQYRIEVQFKLTEIFPPLVNSETSVSRLKHTVDNLKGLEFKAIDRPSMVSEDFGAITSSGESCYFWVGAGKDRPPLHASNFDFNDELIKIVPSILKQLCI